MYYIIVLQQNERLIRFVSLDGQSHWLSNARILLPFRVQLAVPRLIFEFSFDHSDIILGVSLLSYQNFFRSLYYKISTSIPTTPKIERMLPSHATETKRDWRCRAFQLQESQKCFLVSSLLYKRHCPNTRKIWLDEILIIIWKFWYLILLLSQMYFLKYSPFSNLFFKLSTAVLKNS